MIQPTFDPLPGDAAPMAMIATRESRLALWQAGYVRDLLIERFGLQVGLLGMTTRGDQILDVALSKVGGKGLFVKELEVAMAEGRADLARIFLYGMKINLFYFTILRAKKIIR